MSGITDDRIQATLADTATKIRLDAKRAALAQLLQQQQADVGVFPLSFAQQRLWFLDQWEPGSPLYNIPLAIRLQGPLNHAALEASFNEVVKRHETLRTRFVASGGRPLQMIMPELRLTMSVLDLSTFPSDDLQEAEVERLANAEAEHAFDLRYGPLLRTTLLRLAPEKHVLLLNLHHIAADGWSVSILLQEATQYYAALTQNTPLTLPSLPIQYIDYAAWQRKWLAEAAQQELLAYWRKQLADMPMQLNLPSDFQYSAQQVHQNDVQSSLLPRALVDALKQLSQQEHATLFMTLLTAFYVLLMRYTAQTDLVVGAPIANRNRREIEGVIGVFINTLVLRTDLSGDPTFRAALQRVRLVMLGAYEHQDLPIEHLIKMLQPERDMNRASLFQVMVNMLNLPEQNTSWSKLQVEVGWPYKNISKFDMTLYLTEQERGLQIEVVYNSDLYAKERIVEMLQQLAVLLQQVVLDPDEHINRYSLITKKSHHLLPDPTLALDTTWHGSIQERLSHQARRIPQQVAVADEQDVWSYQALDQYCNRLANFLVAHDVAPQQVVAIYAHRSSSLMWALFGVLKAGAAYVILDPAYPTARLSEIIEAAKPVALLQIEAAGALPHDLENQARRLSCHLILPRLQTLLNGSFLDEYSTDDPQIAVGPDDLACVAFTSGSTGRPKGILQLHGSLTHFLPWQAQTFGLDASDHYSLLSGLAHDPLQRDLFTALWTGASIFIPSPEELGTPGWIAGWMQREAITVAHLTPAMLQLLTTGISTAGGNAAILQIPSLRYALVVGDMLTWHDVARLRRLAPQVNIVNLFGTTETQRAVGYLVVSALESEEMSSIQQAKEVIPLGQGFQDAQVLVLNQAQRLAGIGEVGEICLRSPHLARGYLDDEWLTGERFVTNPYTHLPTDRLYRTGDLGRYLPDGNIEPLGRNDQQVKLRGFRIELAEIEAAIRAYSQVQDAVVILRAGAAEEKRLIAYIVPIPDSQVLDFTSDLQQAVRLRLPVYMLPSVYVFLKALPVTPNGKIDRQALPAPYQEITDAEAANDDMFTPVEAQIAAIWCEVLGIQGVQRHDDFFQLGGHSLLATQVIARLRDTFEIGLPVRALFEASSVASLAQVIEQRQNIALHEQATNTSIRRVVRDKNSEVLRRLSRVSEAELQAMLAALRERKAQTANEAETLEDGVMGDNGQKQ